MHVPDDDVFAQDGYWLRLEWGPDGLAALAPRCAVLVVVDVLSFSTSVDIAVGRGARVLPLSDRLGQSTKSARDMGAVMAGEQKWSLRPSSLTDLPAGTVLALPSPNGATLCARAAAMGATVLAGCLRNASSVAHAAVERARGGPIGILPAGERWGVTSGPLRPGIEDLLGAGAIAAALLAIDKTDASPEVTVAASTFAHALDQLARTLAECTSGRELIAGGHRADVELAAAVESSACAPVLRDGVLTDRLST